MRTLDEIAIAQGTDKATVFTRTYAKPKGYTIHMEQFFEPLREQPIKLLEIGVGGGESIRAWLEYFVNAKVYGIDNNTDTNPWNTPHSTLTPHPRYQFAHGDQTDQTMWKCLIANWGKEWDIIIDDGAHTNAATILSFNGLWPVLKTGGLYVIEDLATAYGNDPFFANPGYPNQIDWLRTKIDDMNQRRGDVASIYFSRELAILRKK